MAPSTVQSRGHRPRDWRMAVEVVAFTAPALILFAMFIVWPMVRAVQFSLYRWKGFGPLVDFVGLKNYIDVFTRPDTLSSLKLSLYYMVGALIQVALAKRLRPSTPMSSGASAKRARCWPWRSLAMACTRTSR